MDPRCRVLANSPKLTVGASELVAHVRLASARSLLSAELPDHCLPARPSENGLRMEAPIHYRRSRSAALGEPGAVRLFRAPEPGAVVIPQDPHRDGDAKEDAARPLEDLLLHRRGHRWVGPPAVLPVIPVRVSVLDRCRPVRRGDYAGRRKRETPDAHTFGVRQRLLGVPGTGEEDEGSTRTGIRAQELLHVWTAYCLALPLHLRQRCRGSDVDEVMVALEAVRLDGQVTVLSVAGQCWRTRAGN